MTASARRAVIVGCGRQGAYLAVGLERAGWGVAVVDRNAAAFDGLPDPLKPSCVAGEAFSSDTLESAGISGAYALIATTEDDDRNVLVASIGRYFGVRRTIARVRAPEAVGLGVLGIETVCPTTLEASVIHERLALVESSTTAKRLRIVIIGCGRLGAHLAVELAREQGDLLVIDRSAAALERLRAAGFGGLVLGGDATEPPTLRRAAIAEAAVVVAIREDRESLMAALVAQKLFGAKEVLARVSDPERAAMCRDLGLAAVCPTALCGEATLALLASEPEVRRSKLEDSW